MSEFSRKKYFEIDLIKMIEILNIYIYIYIYIYMFLGICYKIKKSYPIFILYLALFFVYMNLLEDLFFCLDFVATLL